MKKEVLFEVNRYRELMGLNLLNEGVIQPFPLKKVLLSILEKSSGNIKNILTKAKLTPTESKLKNLIDDLQSSLNLTTNQILLKIDGNLLRDDEFEKLVVAIMKNDETFYKKMFNQYVSYNPALKQIEDLPDILTANMNQTKIIPTKGDVEQLRTMLNNLVERDTTLGPDVKKIFKDKINASLTKFESTLGAKIENIKIDPDIKDINLSKIRTMIGPSYRSVMNLIRPSIDTWIKSGFKKWDESKQNELILDIGKKLSVIVNDYKELKGFGEARNKIKTLAKDISISLELVGQKAGEVSGIKGQKASYNDLMNSVEKSLRENGVERPDEVINFIKKYDTQPGKSWFMDEVLKESGYAKVWRLGSKDPKVKGDAWYRLIEGLFVTGIFSKSIRQMLQEIKSLSGPKRIGKIIYLLVYMNTVGYLIAESIFTLFYCIFASIKNYFTDEEEKKNYGTFIQFYLKELWDEIVQKYTTNPLYQIIFPRGGITDNIYDFLNQSAQGKTDSLHLLDTVSEKYEKIKQKYENATDEQQRKIDEIWNGEGTEDEKMKKIQDMFEGESESESESKSETSTSGEKETKKTKVTSQEIGQQLENENGDWVSKYVDSIESMGDGTFKVFYVREEGEPEDSPRKFNKIKRSDTGELVYAGGSKQGEKYP